MISEIFGDPDAKTTKVADYIVGNKLGPTSGNGVGSVQRAASRFCDSVLEGGEWNDEFLPSNRDEGFAFLRSCAEHLRSLLRSPDRFVELRSIERWYRFLDDAAWRMKTMNMNPEATISDIFRSMSEGSEPPMRRW